MSIKAIIIDDELRARTLLKGLLGEFCKEVEVVADCDDLPNGVKAIRKHRPDLVFLDIEMPGHSGLELLEFFNDEEVNFSIVFTTAYNQYAVQAFKLSAIDYLLKPIEPGELENTIARYKKRNVNERVSTDLLKESLKGNGANKIAVPTGNGTRFIELSTIIYLRAENTYTEILTNDDKKILVSRTLKNFEDALSNNPKFFRSHKSYIVNTDYITDYVKSDGGYLVLNKKYEVSIASDKVQDFLEMSILIKR